MRTIISGIGFVLIMFALLACGNSESEQERLLKSNPDASSIVLEWLSLIDRGGYDEAWQFTAEEFRAESTLEEWREELATTREASTFGRERRIDYIEKSTSLPDFGVTGKFITCYILTELQSDGVWCSGVGMGVKI